MDNASGRSTGPHSDRLVALAIYFHPKLLVVLALGFSSGLPLALTGSTLNIWMAEEGVSLTTIGLFSLVGLPYVLKPLWAPLIDAVRLPILHAKLGRRRSWLVLSQALLMLIIAIMGGIDPVATPLLMALCALGVAFMSATQDIVIDAFRTEYLDESEYGAGMANYVAAYRIAMLTSMAGALYLVAFLEAAGFAPDRVWQIAWQIMAVLVLVGMAAALLATEPDGDTKREQPAGLAERFVHFVIHPFTDFMKKPLWAAFLAFVLLFKLGDALAGSMTAVFVIDLGFLRTDYAKIVGIYGLGATLVGGFIGGYVQKVAPLTPTLWAAGVMMMLSNLAFVWLALVGQSTPVLMAAVTIENVTGGFGTVVFVAFISRLCTNRDFTATQFALLTALAAMGRVVFSASSGFIVEHTSWTTFFVITTLAALPGLAFLALMSRRRIFDAL
jgi:PAT family beta-lactamase induction signal transducer AmpG